MSKTSRNLTKQQVPNQFSQGQVKSKKQKRKIAAKEKQKRKKSERGLNVSRWVGFQFERHLIQPRSFFVGAFVYISPSLFSLRWFLFASHYSTARVSPLFSPHATSSSRFRNLPKQTLTEIHIRRHDESGYISRVRNFVANPNHIGEMSQIRGRTFNVTFVFYHAIYV